MKELMLITTLLIIVGCSQENKDHKNHEDHPIAFDINYIDSTTSPCENFYQYAIGNWQANNPVPETESRWMAFNILNEENRKKLLKIVDDVAQNDNVKQGTEEQMIRDFYRSGLDTLAIESKGISEISDFLLRIDNATSIADIQELFGVLSPIGINTPIGLYISADSKNSKMNIVYAGQSGLNLPDRDYYLNENPKFQDIRKAYVEHINNMMHMAEDTTSPGQNILDLETALAEISWSRLERRDPNKRYNKKNLEDWDNSLNVIDIQSILSNRGFGTFDTIIVSQPSFYDALNDLLVEQPISSWKSYMKWNVVSSFASFLNQSMVEERFSFYSKKLRGTQMMKPRDERVFSVINRSLGEPLGKLFVKSYFDEESKQYMTNMIENLRTAYRERINDLSWMSSETKEKALKKLNAFTYKIGYPDQWRDYSKLIIESDSYIQNIIRVRKFGYNRMLERLGKPVDKSEWSMSPQTVNAYYSSSNNEIVFPAGILQPPFFHKTFDHAINYGGIGAVIGHEFSHGFDDQGSKFDWDGNLNSWWTEDDREKFDQLAQKLGKQYDSYSPVDGMNVNGKMTMGENIADLGGVTLAYNALQLEYKEDTPEDIDGFTWQQRFFLGWANVWKGNIKEEEMVNRLKSDVHSPAEYRVLGPLVNFEPYYQAFGSCETGTMYKPDSSRIAIW
ncbi:MAG: M13 family metallopeptidase [Bacteroidia bacterium]|nr:M13 family metallopeptidase [Bacteroidia bacterium]